MEFIEVRPGLAIKKGEIVMIERLDDSTTRITFRDGNEVNTEFFYDTLLMSLEQDKIKSGSVLERIADSLSETTFPR